MSQNIGPHQVDFQQIIRTNLADKHGRFDFYYSKAVDKIVKDAPNQRIVAVFKDFLIYDDSSCECLRKLYSIDESCDKLRKLTEFYTDYADIFPSYALLLQPCQDETTMLMRDQEGMAKYMYKNIRRKQRMIDEKFSIIERNKVKDKNNANLAVERRHQQKGYKHHSKHNKQDKIFFTPSFLNSVIKFEQHLAKRDRILYLKRLAFGMSMGDMLDQFIEKDTQQVSIQENFYCGRVIEPLHLIDNIFHVELEKNLQRQEKLKRSKSRSKSPLHSEMRQQQRMQLKLPINNNNFTYNIKKIKPQIQNSGSQQRQSISPHSNKQQNRMSKYLTKNTTIATQNTNIITQRLPRYDRSKGTPTPKKQSKPKTSLSPFQKSAARKSISPSIAQDRTPNKSSPIRTSLQKRSPMKNIINLNTSPKLAQNHQILRNKTTPIKDLGKPPQQLRPNHSPVTSPQSMYNKTTSLALGQSIKLLLKANKDQNSNQFGMSTMISNNSNIKSSRGVQYSHRKQDNTQFDTPSKNIVRTREVSGSKGRLQTSDSKYRETIITNLRFIPPYQDNKLDGFNNNQDDTSNMLDFSRNLEQKHTTASKIRESIVKRPVAQNGLGINRQSIQVQAFNDEKIFSINIPQQVFGKDYTRIQNDINSVSTMTLLSNNKTTTTNHNNMYNHPFSNLVQNQLHQNQQPYELIKTERLINNANSLKQITPNHSQSKRYSMNQTQSINPINQVNLFKSSTLQHSHRHQLQQQQQSQDQNLRLSSYQIQQNILNQRLKAEEVKLKKQLKKERYSININQNSNSYNYNITQKLLTQNIKNQITSKNSVVNNENTNTMSLLKYL